MPCYLSIESQGEVMMSLTSNVDQGIKDYDDDDYEYSDDNKEDRTTEYVAPPATALPPPGFEGSNNNAFSNWLGSLAATSSGMKLDDLPAPPPVIADPVPSHAISSEKNKLLSPTRFTNKDNSIVMDDSVSRIISLPADNKSKEQSSRTKEEQQNHQINPNHISNIIHNLPENKSNDKKSKDKSTASIKKEREVSPQVRTTQKVEKLNSKTSSKSITPTKKSKGQQQQQQSAQNSTTTAPLTILKREDNNPPPPPNNNHHKYKYQM